MLGRWWGMNRHGFAARKPALPRPCSSRLPKWGEFLARTVLSWSRNK